jgi:hypothetical protein
VGDLIQAFPFQTWLITWSATVWLVLVIAQELRRALRGVPSIRRGQVVFFGPAWWLISLAPMIVTYVSARHAYPAAVGLALVCGIAVDTLLRSVKGRRQIAVLVGSALVLGTYAFMLIREVEHWDAAAKISEAVTRDFAAAAATAPDGSLFILDPPFRDGLSLPTDGTPIPVWAWGLPYAVGPPFVASRVRERMYAIGPPEVACCPRHVWYTQTTDTLRAWRTGTGPLMVLQWDPVTGALSQRSEESAPDLRDAAAALGSAGTPDELESGLRRILEQRPAAPAD